MASNYTTNYQLPLWAADDAFLRTEFNDANQKIDAALASKADAAAVEDRVKKLKSGTTTADANKISIDLAGIDLAQYRELKLYLTGSINSNVELYMTLNNDQSSEYLTGNGSSTSACIGLTSSFENYASLTCELFPTGLSGGAVGVSYHVMGTGSSSFFRPEQGMACHRSLAFSDLTSIEFFAKSGFKLMAGLSYDLYGLRK